MMKEGPLDPTLSLFATERSNICNKSSKQFDTLTTTVDDIISYISYVPMVSENDKLLIVIIIVFYIGRVSMVYSGAAHSDLV